MSRSKYNYRYCIAVGLALAVTCLSACSAPENQLHREVYVDTSQWHVNAPEYYITIGPANVRFDVAMESMASRISDYMSAEGKTKVAIVDFQTLQGEKPDFVGHFISKQLVSLLFLADRFELTDRRSLQKLLDEQNLDRADLADDATIRRLGFLLGVDAVVVGTYADLGSEITVDGRLVSVESDQVCSVASELVKKDERISALLETAPGKPDPLERYNRTLRPPRIKRARPTD